MSGIKNLKANNSESFEAEKYYLLGIDGGATKTHLVLSDTEMNILRELKTECCNPIDIGINEAKALLKAAIYEICDGIPLKNTVMFAGISGGSSSDMKSRLSEFFGELGLCAYENDSDNLNLIAAGLGSENGVTLIMGTGICAFCQKDSVFTRTAGWGYLFDDGGSAYNIGRDGLAAHFRATDGSGKQTLISDAIKQEYPDPQVLLGRLYSGGKKLIASYARYVYDAAKKNDEIATEILNNNIRFAANVIKTAAASLTEPKVKVVIAGGLTKEPITLELIRKELSGPKEYDVQILDTAPVQGALILAKKLYEKIKGAND